MAAASKMITDLQQQRATSHQALEAAHQRIAALEAALAARNDDLAAVSGAAAAAHIEAERSAAAARWLQQDAAEKLRLLVGQREGEMAAVYADLEVARASA